MIKSSEHPKKRYVSPPKKEKSPERDDNKPKHYVSLQKKEQSPVGPPPPQRVNPPSQCEIKPSDMEKPINATPIEKSNAKDSKSYFEIFQKGYKPPVQKQQTEEDETYLQVFIWKSDLENYCNYEGTIKQANTSGALFSIAQNLLHIATNVAKKGTNLLFYKYYSTSVMYGNKTG